MTKQEQLKLIDQAFSRLDRVCESSRHWDQYLALIKQEENDQRRFVPHGLKPGLTRRQSIELFAVKTVFDRFVPKESGKVFTPEAKDFFWVRKSIFAACAIVDIFPDRIREKFTLDEMAHFLASVDYVKLSEDPKFPRKEETAA